MRGGNRSSFGLHEFVRESACAFAATLYSSSAPAQVESLYSCSRRGFESADAASFASTCTRIDDENDAKENMFAPGLLNYELLSCSNFSSSSFLLFRKNSFFFQTVWTTRRL